jgi:hypothetical protein
MSSLVDDLANAIANYEAASGSNPLSVRNNNPGNLRSWGDYPVVNGYVQCLVADASSAAAVPLDPTLLQAIRRA